MQSLANYVIKNLIKNNLIASGEEDKYRYGLEILLGKILNYSTVIIIALFTNRLIPTVFFLLSFLSLRKRAGGYHAKTAFRCYLGTVSTYVLSCVVIIPIYAGNSRAEFLILIVSAISILVFAPVNHPNLDFDKDEILANKHIIKKILIFLFVGIGMLLIGSEVLPKARVYGTYALAGIGVNAVLVCLSKVTKQDISGKDVLTGE